MDSIAKSAGLDKATLYHYFPTKKDIHNAVLMDVFETLDRLSVNQMAKKTDPGDELTEFIGDPGISPERLASPNTLIMMGVPPTRIGVLTSIPGIEFADAWAGRAEGRYGGEPVAFLGLEDLIQAKRASGRDQDLRDAERLERVRELGRSGGEDRGRPEGS